MSQPWRVVKVGGSLYDLPDLATRLRGWLGALPTLLVPGGGSVAEAVRALDRTHTLGAETAHRLALQAMSLNARFLAQLLPAVPVVSRLPTETVGCALIDALPYFAADDTRPGRLPHTWDVTSDSLAVRVAVLASARELVLLKSVTWSEGDAWTKASAAGIVDPFFPTALHQAPLLSVRIVNLRSADSATAAALPDRGHAAR